ncbi:hypothetical protein [Aliivibrio logei]|uniref:Uncharacterized protein n=1 Tax=Aliivibrio logei TaxID=688 RepID=A0A1B9NW17_ALILO|nr:hypothetical protein [Aliivibrio logei]OCH19093.1 hypothetical protein A6E04_16915 [Aliivibrio logei]
MTMIVGIHLDDYVIVAADKREVMMLGDVVVNVISNKVEKLIEWNGGVITGSGYVPLLNDLKYYLAENEVNHTGQLLDYANTAASNIALNQASWKKQTNWMFSYLSQIDDQRVTRLGYVMSSKVDGTHMLKPMSATIWAKLPDIDTRIKDLNSQLLPLDSLDQIKENLDYHVSMLKGLFEYAATVDKTVCKDFSYFVQSHHGFSQLFASGQA